MRGWLGCRVAHASLTGKKMQIGAKFSTPSGGAPLTWRTTRRIGRTRHLRFPVLRQTGGYPETGFEEASNQIPTCWQKSIRDARSQDFDRIAFALCHP